jgi:hypothetical protein
MKLIRIAAAAAGLALAAGIGMAAAPAASASVRPAIAATVNAPTRHTVVVEPCVYHGKMLVCWMDLSSRFQLTCGPSTWIQGMHWSTWNNREAVGRGTEYITDLHTWNEGRVTVVLYHPLNSVDIGGRDYPYFSRVHFDSSKWGSSYGHWSWSVGWWIGGK